MPSTLRFGLIGAGRIGPVHAATLAYHVPEASLAAVADINPQTAQSIAARFGVPRILASGAEIIADPEIDAIAICSPTDTHASLIVAAAAAGKHIFCEKPISLSLSEIDRALAAVAAAGVKLQVGFNRRFDSNFLRVRQAVGLWADRAGDGKAAADGRRRPAGEARLTPQEYAMITQIAGGTGNEEAAKRLGLSLRAATKSLGGRPAAGDLASLMGLASNGGAEDKQAAARAPAKASSRTGKPGRPRIRPPGTSRSRRRPLAGTDRDC